MIGPRAVHAVGSMPLDIPTAEQAMRVTLDAIAPYLRSLPDGEAGRNYVTPVVDALVNHPALKQISTGDWSSLTKRPMYKVRRGQTIRDERLDDFLLYLTGADESWPTFRRLREEYDRPDLTFQVGLPTDFVISFITFGPQRALQNRRAFTEATLRGIQRIHEMAGDDVIFQLETPAETLLSSKAPKPVRAAVAKRLANGLANLARHSPPGTRFGLHMCLGSLHDRAEASVTSAGQFAALVNAARECWPSDRTLEFAHLPLVTDRGEKFFRSLNQLDLDDNLRLAAGIVREDLPFDDRRRVLGWIESAVGRQVDVSPVCGLGRRKNQAIAVKALEQAAALAASDS